MSPEEFTSTTTAGPPKALLLMESLAKWRGKLAKLRAESLALVGNPSASAKRRRQEISVEAQECQSQIAAIATPTRRKVAR